MKSYPTKLKNSQRKIVQMRALRKSQNSIQTLIVLWPVYPIHAQSLFLVIFEEVPFCHFPPPNTSIRGINLVDLSFEYLEQTENNHTLCQSSHVSAMAYVKTV